MHTDSYCGHRVILPEAVRQPQFCWAITPTPDWHQSRCSQGTGTKVRNLLQEFSRWHVGDAAASSALESFQLTGPNIKTDKLQKKCRSQRRLFAAMSCPFYCSFHTLSEH